MIRRVRLNEEVRPGKGVAPEDLGQVRRTLSHLGLFDPSRDLPKGETQMGAGLKRALRVFQSGQGLREDAVLRPRGPTEERLNLLLEQERGLGTAAPGADRQGRSNLAGRVGLGLENHPDDVTAVGTALRRTGHIKPGARNPPSTGMVFDGLKAFQRASGLERDGIIAPGGPTEQLLARSLGVRLPAPQRVGVDPTPAPDLIAGPAEDELLLGQAASDRLSDSG